MHAAEPLPILMLPGIAADHRLFAAQRREFPQMQVPTWPEMTALDLDMAQYARRCADEWIFGQTPCFSIDQPYFLGGMSMGGAVAIELAWHLESLGKAPEGVLLLGGCRGCDAVPHWYTRWYQWSQRLPHWLASKLFHHRQVIHSTRCEHADPRTTQQVASMLRGTEWNQLRGSVRVLIDWRRDSVDLSRAPFPIHQLHGRLDALIPPPSAKDATLLLNAGHWMCMTHPAAVNNWLAAILADARIRLLRPGKRR